MSRKAKNTNELWFEDKTSLTYVMLPEGYFYKGKYYTSGKLFSALLKDKEVYVHSYPNGTWKYKDLLYTSLREVYEWTEDEIAMSYKEFVNNYKALGVEHNPINRTLYSYDRDEFNILFSSKTEVISELKFEVSNNRFLADTEEYEEEYINTLTKEECVLYFKKSIKERIAILEKWGAQNSMIKGN